MNVNIFLRADIVLLKIGPVNLSVFIIKDLIIVILLSGRSQPNRPA